MFGIGALYHATLLPAVSFRGKSTDERNEMARKDELFSKYPTLWPQRGDDERTIRDKARARAALERAVFLAAEEAEFTWAEAKSAIVFTCAHQGKTVIFRIYPTFSAWKKGDWSDAAGDARIAHRMNCEWPEHEYRNKKR
jgi:hypothetical protein